MGSIIPAGVRAKVREKKIPLFCTFALTWRCNHKCIHCHPYLADSQDLATADVKSALRELAARGCFFLKFTGGEPLLRSDFWEIAETARDLSFAVSLNTNGSFVTPEAAGRIRDLGMAQVKVNLLGASAETHDGISGVPGSFEKALSAVRCLKKEEINVVARAVLMRPNFDEFEEIIQLASDMGIDHLVTPAVFSSADKMPLDLGLDEKQMTSLQEYISTLEDDDLAPYARKDRPLWRSSVPEKLFGAAPIVLSNLEDDLFFTVSKGKLEEYK